MDLRQDRPAPVHGNLRRAHAGADRRPGALHAQRGVDHAGRHGVGQPADAVGGAGRLLLGGVHRLLALPGADLRLAHRPVHGSVEPCGGGDAFHRLHGADERGDLLHRLVAGACHRALRVPGHAAHGRRIRPRLPGGASADERPAPIGGGAS